jgi:hypothetical protein
MPRRQPQWCEDYPHCSCLANLNEWLGRIEDDVPFDFEWAVLSSYVSLSCLAKHFPDRTLRIWASMQLAHRIYAEERRRNALRGYR